MVEEIPLRNGATSNSLSRYSLSEFDQVRIQSNLAPGSVVINTSYFEQCDDCGLNNSQSSYTTQNGSLYHSIPSANESIAYYYSYVDFEAMDEYGNRVPGTWTIISTFRSNGKEINYMTLDNSGYGINTKPLLGCDLVAHFEDWSPGITLFGTVSLHAY